MPERGRMEDIRHLILEQADFISSHQLPSGAIPWYEAGTTDPWDHIECAIALDAVGRHDEAIRAYRWLIDIQNSDGSWYSRYLDGQPQDLTKDANYCSYIATGVWYHYLFTNDATFLREIWPTVETGLDFVLTLQQPTGEINWSYDADGNAWPGALMAGSSCIWQCIRNGMKIAELVGRARPDWGVAARRLVSAIRECPHLFDRFGEDRQRFATTWFYPVLTRVIEGEQARDHILKRWRDFVVEDWGCKCVSTAPWVTVAETSELVIALCLIGELDRARLLMDWILRLRDPAGGFKTGVKLPEEIIWPEEKNTWTSAGVIMALRAQGQE